MIQNFGEFKTLSDKRKVLYWKLVGQAAIAYPDEYGQIVAMHAIIAHEEGWDTGRELAEIVAVCAKRWPTLAFTHA